MRRYVAAVMRYKWWIILIAAIGTIGGVAAASLVKPVYAARATLWIETSSPDADRTGPIRPAELLESSSWIELLRSPVVLDSVVRELRLFWEAGRPGDQHLLSNMDFEAGYAIGAFDISVSSATGVYTLKNAAGTVVEEGRVGDVVGKQLGIYWKPDFARFPPDRPVRFTLRPSREVALQLATELQATLDRNGNFLQLRLEHHDAKRLAETLNEIAHRYVAVAADLKRARLDELVSILEEQLQYAQQRLKNAEMSLEDFRVRTVTLPSDRSTPVAPGLQMTQDPVFQNFFEMRVRLESIRQDQDLLRRAMAGGPGSASFEAVGSVGAVQESPELVSAIQELAQKRAELRALRYRYTDEHSLVQQLIGEIRALENQTLPDLTRQVMGELALREQQLESRLGAASAELERIPPRAIEEARLTRTVESADNLYSNLLRRFEEARLAAASSIPDVRVLDEAVVPRQPLRDQKPQLILLAFFGSLGLGVLGAVLRDRFDPRLRYPSQVTELGLTILGAVPNLRGGRGPFGRDNTTQAQESFRSLRLSVMHAFGAAGPLVITVTSPGPGDGKSFVCANLGRAFADIGKKVLLVDGDTRRGRLHDLFSIQRKPGLTDLLLDPELPMRPVISATNHPGLSVLPSGKRLQQGPELLSSRRMRDLLVEVRADFDVIIVDSPPLGAGVDPFALSAVVGSTLLVFRTGETDRQLADAKLELLDRLPIRLLGAVLNGVPATREYRYYSYTPGYDSWNEEPPEPAALLAD